jgi:hypothetical protein
MREANRFVALARRFSHFVLGAIWVAIVALGRAFAVTFKLLRFAFLAVIVAVLFIVVAWVFLVTPRNFAHRYSVPGVATVADASSKDPCTIQSKNAEILAKTGNLEDGHKDITQEIRLGFTCMLQTHSLPVATEARWPGSASPMGPIRYHLAFLEFQENGYPAERGLDNRSLDKPQLDVLLEHLGRQKRNYVLAYIHGWRHDASIGNEDVRLLRLYAAHVASFLDYRCKSAGRDCDSTVTAVYVGWRGARVDERKWKNFVNRRLGWLGSDTRKSVGEAIAGPASLTLFDRKPVSERIGPAAVASLSEISRLLAARNNSKPGNSPDRMITIGHSLGGNMLASALKEQLVARIRDHKPGEIMKAPFGNLIVLINPASEASNWTALQRAMRQRVAFSDDNAYFSPETKQGTSFFRKDQPPIVVSLTAAFAWPAAPRRMREELGQEEKDKSGYDWATHDLFPAFKGDLRPWSESLEFFSHYYKGEAKDSKMCPASSSFHATCKSTMATLTSSLASVMRNVPFMNTESEDTRAIGHLDPMRPPYGHYGFYNRQSPEPYGTTHEIVLNNSVGHFTRYLNAAQPYRSECAIVDHWLWNAKTGRGLGPLTSGWDSGWSRVRPDGSISPHPQTPNLTPVRPRTTKEGHLETQFRQYLSQAGTQSVVHANDPFWNVRAFDTVIDGHSGFVSYPLICSINQMVMDDIASKPPN